MKRLILCSSLLIALAACAGGDSGGGSDGGSNPAALTITTAALTAGTHGLAYSASVTATGGSASGYTWSIMTGTLPAGLSLATSGTPDTSISGTPGAFGTFNFTVQVMDSAGATATMPLQLDVAPPALMITTTSLPDAINGQAYNATVSAAGGSAAGYSWNIISGALPTGLSLAPTGTPGSGLTGTPGAVGVFSFTVEVSDSLGAAATQVLQIDIVAAPALAISTAPDLPDGIDGAAYSQTISASGGTGSGYTWSVIEGELPFGLSLSGSGTPSASLTGTPTAFGRWYFTVQVTDSGADTATLEMNLIVVYPANADEWPVNFNLASDGGGTAVFTGSKILQFGGEFAASNRGDIMVPGAGTSSSMSTTGAPSARVEHAAVWTGRRMLVYGGRDAGTYFSDCFSYDPFADTWTAITASGAPSARANHTAVWSGTEMIVFGGHDSAFNPLDDGGAYDPVTGTWRAIAAVPTGMVGRERHAAVWTGTAMIVWGGFSPGGGDTYDGGIYDPAADSWGQVTATGAPTLQPYQCAVVWTGTRLFVWGADITAVMQGAEWNPATNTWATIGTWFMFRREMAHVATPDGVFIWGGLDFNGTFAQNDGEFFDHSVQNWSTVATPSLVGRFNVKAFWTGRQVIVWGGKDFGFAGTNPQSDGALYNP